MKELLKNKKVIIAAAVVLAAAIIFGAYSIWLYQQPKFQNVTVELGTDTVKVEQFLTEYANPKRVSFGSDVSQIDLNQACENELILRHGNQEETVVLQVVDTTAPVAEFATDLVFQADHVLTPEDFVVSVEDFAVTTLAFAEEPQMPYDCSDITVTVLVTDASGNSVQGECTAGFTWLRETVALEYGDTLELADVLVFPEEDAEMIAQEELDFINSAEPGEYVITSTNDVKTVECVVTVADTLGPVLEVTDVKRYPGDTCDVEAFLVSAEDVSGQVEVRLMTELTFDELGIQEVVIEAEDIYGNITQVQTHLSITNDHEAPKLQGVEDLTVDKHTEIDYLEGITATDNIDPECKIEVDASGVDVDAAGTYYAVYTVTDNSLNTTTVKRKINVNHDEEDVKALVQSIAAQLSDDPEEIRDYVRTISYSTNWGGDDPVWFGFTKGTGNCYVHAMCLQALFNEKGIENQLIWVTSKSRPHYWLIFKMGDVWRHIDATPTRNHMVYSIMTDKQRLASLGGRKWDFDAWPACE